MISSIISQINVTQPTTDSLAVAEGQTEKTLSILELITSGGVGGIIIMSALFVLSIIAVYIFIERFISIKKAAEEDQNFMNQIKDFIHDGKLEAARSLCKSTPTPISRMIEKGVNRIGKPLSDIAAAIENTGKLELFKLEKNLATLATISGAAPMIGFLGTVIGMILSIFEIANSGGSIDIKTLADGLYTAMTTTVAGLIVGIVAYIAYNHLVVKTDKVVYQMEANSLEFLDLLNEPS